MARSSPSTRAKDWCSTSAGWFEGNPQGWFMCHTNRCNTLSVGWAIVLGRVPGVERPSPGCWERNRHRCLWLGACALCTGACASCCGAGAQGLGVPGGSGFVLCVHTQKFSCIEIVPSGKHPGFSQDTRALGKHPEIFPMAESQGPTTVEMRGTLKHPQDPHKIENGKGAMN